MLIGMTKIVSDVWRGKGFFTQTPEMRWYGGTIPIFFHFVLAAFLYTWGNFHAREAIFASPDSAC